MVLTPRRTLPSFLADSPAVSPAVSPAAAPVVAPAAPDDDLFVRWRALHEAAAVVAAIAGVPTDTARLAAGFAGEPAGGLDAFPAALRRAGGWRAALGSQAMADLAAILEAGLRALLAVHGRGADPRVPARALWEEFVAARSGVLALLPPSGVLHSS